MFNGTYTSELNPIEMLWAWSKPKFTRELINVFDFKNEQLIHELITDCILAVSPVSLKLQVDKCFDLMRDYLIHL